MLAWNINSNYLIVIEYLLFLPKLEVWNKINRDLKQINFKSKIKKKIVTS